MEKDSIKIKESMANGEWKIEIDRGNGWEDWTNTVDPQEIMIVKKTATLPYCQAVKYFGDYPNFWKTS